MAAVVSVAITVVVRPLLKKAAQEVTNAAAKMYETAKNAVMTAIEKVRSQSKEATRDTTEEKVAPLERPKFCYWEAMRVKVKGGDRGSRRKRTNIYGSKGTRFDGT